MVIVFVPNCESVAPIVAAAAKIAREKVECENKGMRWDVDKGCVEEKVKPVTPPASTPVATSSSQTTPTPVNKWAPLKGGVAMRFDPAKGFARFSLRGIRRDKLPAKEWFPFNVKGRHATGMQQCHLLMDHRISDMRLVCQQFAPFRERQTGHEWVFDPSQEYRFVVVWDVSVQVEIFDGLSRVAVMTLKPPSPFASIDEVVVGNGVFPGYPLLGGVEIKK